MILLIFVQPDMFVQVLSNIFCFCTVSKRYVYAQPDINVDKIMICLQCKGYVMNIFLSEAEQVVGHWEMLKLTFIG